MRRGLIASCIAALVLLLFPSGLVFAQGDAERRAEVEGQILCLQRELAELRGQEASVENIARIQELEDELVRQHTTLDALGGSDEPSSRQEMERTVRETRAEIEQELAELRAEETTDATEQRIEQLERELRQIRQAELNLRIVEYVEARDRLRAQGSLTEGEHAELEGIEADLDLLEQERRELRNERMRAVFESTAELTEQLSAIADEATREQVVDELCLEIAVRFFLEFAEMATGGASLGPNEAAEWFALSVAMAAVIGYERLTNPQFVLAVRQRLEDAGVSGSNEINRCADDFAVGIGCDANLAPALCDFECSGLAPSPDERRAQLLDQNSQLREELGHLLHPNERMSEIVDVLLPGLRCPEQGGCGDVDRERDALVEEYGRLRSSEEIFARIVEIDQELTELSNEFRLIEHCQGR